MELDLTNKVFIVTGGAKGIGEGIVRVLCDEGAIVAIVGRNESDNRKLQQELKDSVGGTLSVVAELEQPGGLRKSGGNHRSEIRTHRRTGK
jgi:NAD(P)-dependent dehydrogenase (short-subunit alcohol dehydrogenase family)